MPEIGLCMSVRDEARNIVDCLAPIADLFAEIVIIDTGSTDETPALLTDVLGIAVHREPLDEDRCGALADVRNLGFDRLSTPWLLTLDADERLDRGALEATIALCDRDLPAGLFCAWDTDFGDGLIVPDYKLALFRRHHRHLGLVHDTAQPSLRLAQETAAWLPDLRIRHFPDPARSGYKEVRYERRLACAMRREPEWLRYRWFSGYQAYRRGDMTAARDHLTLLHVERPPLFPVESLNASMVLAGILAEAGDRAAALEVLTQARAFHQRVADDFEVRVNLAIGQWLDHALSLAEAGDMRDIAPPRFPY